MTEQDGKLRIVHCFRSPVGGVFRHVRDLCRAQAEAGHEIGIVCDSTTGGAFEARLFTEIEDSLALGVERTPMQRHVGLGDVAAALQTYRIVRQMRPDVLHGHGAKGGVYARLFGTALRLRGSNVARLYSPHGGSLHYDYDSLTGRFFFALEWLMDRRSDHLLFVSDHERRAFRDKIGTPKAPSSLVYNGLHASEFDPVTALPDAADFVYVGMMRDLKGPDLFIEALATAGGEGCAPTAVMVGDGDERADYEEQARRLGLEERIRFLSAMPARQAFTLGRTVVVPSRAEAMPYIVLEALAAGKPLIASAVGGIPEIFGDHSRGLTRPEAGEIALRMREALDDEASFAAGMPPVETLKARFGADVMARGVEAAYRAALGRRAPQA